MATKELLAQLKLRKDTAANWTEKNPIIGNGEMIIVETSSGEQRFKLGDGEKTFTQLPYTDENLLSKIKTYSAGDGINISDEGVISSIGGSSSSDVFVIEIDEQTVQILNGFDDIKNAIQNKKALIGCQTENACFPMYGSYTNTSGEGELITLMSFEGVFTVEWRLTRGSGTSNVIQDLNQYDMPSANSSNPPASGAAYWNATNKSWEIKDMASSSEELCATVTLGEKDASHSVGGWVLVYPGTVTNNVTYDQALTAFNSNIPVKLRVTSTKEVEVNGATVSIPVLSEVYMTRYIAAQNSLIFDYVHNATDLSVSSGGIVWASDGTITCYTATYSFAFDSSDTQAASVEVPTVTKVQSMIDAASTGSSGSASEYTIQVSNVAPAAGTSNKIITFVVEDEV